MISQEELELFNKKGYLKLSNAFERSSAVQVQNFIWGKLAKYGISKDQKTWKQDLVHIQEDYKNEILDACWSEKLKGTISAIIQPNHHMYEGGTPKWGWWPINFYYGCNEEWTIPHEGWHWDGLNLRHGIEETDIGLLLICLFSDVKPHGGATMLAEGSHLLALQHFVENPRSRQHLSLVKGTINNSTWLTRLTSKEDNVHDRNKYFFSTKTENDINLKVVEALGNAGDVYICHPNLLHNAAYNHLKVPRFMCNIAFKLKEKHCLDRKEDLSVLEQIAVLAAKKKMEI